MLAPLALLVSAYATQTPTAAAPGPRPPLVWNWKQRPSLADKAKVYPANATTGGGVFLACILDEHRQPSQCRVAMETSPGQGLGQAALTLTRRWRDPSGHFAQLSTGAPIIVSVTFETPQQIYSRPIYFEASGQGAPQVAEWRSLPTLAEIAAALPDESPATNSAFVECTVAGRGRLSACRIPPLKCGTVQIGLHDCTPGEAAAKPNADPTLLRIAALGRVETASADGRPSAGRAVRFFISVQTDALAPLLLPPIPRPAVSPRYPPQGRPGPSRPRWNPLGPPST